MSLNWLPRVADWQQCLHAACLLPPEASLPELIRLANYSLDFVETIKLDRVLNSVPPTKSLLDRTTPVRLAVLGSSTLSHLLPGIRVGALRRGFRVEIYEGQFGLYQQELADSASKLYKFKPDVVLLSLDAHHIAAGGAKGAEDLAGRLLACWQIAKQQLGAVVVQQTAMPIFRPELGNNEHRYYASRHSILQTFNEKLRASAQAEDVHLLSIDFLVQTQGVGAWYDPAMWHRAKQEVTVKASPLYGDHVARLLASIRGLSYKCLVLDLDNTLWGGVVGDDGLIGLRLGQGDAMGEAFVEFQQYVKALAARGIIIAVCSKNDSVNALSVFDEHPEMLLRRPDIACFMANWDDKATNLRRIAETLNIGLDAMVFVDDNPFERNLIRRELPMVAVPELPDDPAIYEETIAEAGYFEALSITSEDLKRPSMYRDNAERAEALRASTDLSSYLRSLQMKLQWSPFTPVGFSRVTQLINKSNQFNLTTRRYTQEEVSRLASDPAVVTLQLRLTDAYGDNGIVAVVIGRLTSDEDLEIDTWLMSCRVLGRQVEEATLNLLVSAARQRGARRLLGVYLPTKKNALVQDHYRSLGFTRSPARMETGSQWVLLVEEYSPRQTFAETIREGHIFEQGQRDARADICAVN